MAALFTVAPETLTISPWPDPLIDRLGHDPRSWYVETFWLGVLGPSTTWLLRRLVAGLEASPEGFVLSLAETARALGLGDRGGRHSPFLRALHRTVLFELAQPREDDVLAVRSKLPPLSRRHLARLPESLQEAHRRWQEEQLQVPPHVEEQRRSRQLALSLLELGEDREATERQLLRWRYHPALAKESTEWAWDRHCMALAVSTGP